MIGKILGGGILFRTLSTTFLQIFCKIILNSKVIDNFWRNSLSINGLRLVVSIDSPFTPVFLVSIDSLPSTDYS